MSKKKNGNGKRETMDPETGEMIEDEEGGEGARSFTVFLGQIDEGAVAADLTMVNHGLQKRLAKHAEDFGKAVGSLTLKLNFEHGRNGVVCVLADVATKEPKRKAEPSVFFLTKGSNLSLENPRAKQLPLIDVSAPEPVREVPESQRPAPRVVDG